MSDYSESSENNVTDQKDTIKQQRKQIIQTAVHYEGPLPPSSELERYNNIVPGCANILIEMAVKNSEHRMLMDLKSIELHEKALSADLESNARRDTEASRGQWFAFFLGLFALMSGAIMAYLDHPLFGMIVSGIPFFGFLTVFILGRTKDHR